MWNNRSGKRGRLSFEILGLFAVCFAVSVALYFFLGFFGLAAVENYCWKQERPLSEEQLYHLDGVIFSVSLTVSVIFFVVLFLILFGERLSYIFTIIRGVDTLRRGEYGYRLPIEGNNELTLLAEAINYLSETERAVKEKEKCLYEEREALIRTLSHDIRTPLTSVISYTELLSAKENLTPQEWKDYLLLVRKKTDQIKGLTDILLDGGKRNTEFFEDARLLLLQVVGEFEETLEDSYPLEIDLGSCPVFSGRFDVEELRRVFDNLGSNIRKYADPCEKVFLTVQKNGQGVVISQKNTVKPCGEQTESYRMGMYSIQRIAHNYGGHVAVRQDEKEFEIVITLSEF